MSKASEWHRVTDPTPPTGVCQICGPTDILWKSGPRWEGWVCRSITSVSQRDSRIRYLYNLTPSQYEALKESQGFACAICKIPESDRNLAVDHDHACCPGKRSCGRCVRGLLCKRCNTGLGSFRESDDLLDSALRYVRDFRAQEIETL